MLIFRAVSHLGWENPHLQVGAFSRIFGGDSSDDSSSQEGVCPRKDGPKEQFFPWGFNNPKPIFGEFFRRFQPVKIYFHAWVDSNYWEKLIAEKRTSQTLDELTTDHSLKRSPGPGNFNHLTEEKPSVYLVHLGFL